jgi:hypothetical protein
MQPQELPKRNYGKLGLARLLEQAQCTPQQSADITEAFGTSQNLIVQVLKNTDATLPGTEAAYASRGEPIWVDFKHWVSYVSTRTKVPESVACDVLRAVFKGMMFSQWMNL